MPQVTYSIGLLDAGATLVYSGALDVQLVSNGIGGFNAAAGLLTLDGFSPLLLAGQGQGGGNGWNLSGSNSSVAVSTSWIFPSGPSSASAPSYLVGSITLTPAEKTQQNLLVLASQAGIERVDHPVQAGAATAPPANGNISLTLTVLDTSYKQTGTMSFTGQGYWMAVSPVSKYYRVTGTLTGTGLPSGGVSVMGGGGQSYWGVNGQAGDAQLNLQVNGNTFLPNTSDGTLTIGGETSFFIGTGVGQAAGQGS